MSGLPEHYLCATRDSDEEADAESPRAGLAREPLRPSREVAKSRLAKAAALAGVLGLALLVDRSRGDGAGESFRRGGSLGGLPAQLAALRGDMCHTAVEGDACFVDVTWAMRDGIYGHPDWYEDPCPSLSPSSSFEEFQACVYKINQTTCPLPCNPAALPLDDAATTAGPSEDEAPEDEPEDAEEVAPKRVSICHIAEPGEECFNNVKIAMTIGIQEQPGRFPGLSVKSPFEKFQALLHTDPAANCPRPCACHTAVKGESCYENVVWVKETGILAHGDWYAGLSVDSSFEDIQRYLQRAGRGDCGVPCTASAGHGPLEGADEEEATTTTRKRATTVAPIAVRDTVGGESEVAEEATTKTKSAEEAGEVAEVASILGGATTKGREASPSHMSECHTVVEGQKCYKDVRWGMETGIHQHPEWYPELRPDASFEDFQRVLHGKPEMDCPQPCPCKTAQKGEECYDQIRWVLSTGIDQHPAWYSKLSVRSRFEEVQSRLTEDVNSTCPKPCVPRVWGKPSLFCFSVFRSEGYEVELVKSLLEKNVGIFACDQFAVLSDTELPLSKGVTTLRIPPTGAVGVSKDGTAANTLVFMTAWKVVFEDMRWRAHDWILKADPDAVLLPDRIRAELLPHTGKTVFVKNCMKYTGPGWPMMFGSLEAFSNGAIDTYFRRAQECKDRLQWQAWGEDLFMGNCLSMLGVGSVYVERLSGDNVCKGANCADGAHAAYHPFKSPEKWFECYHQATNDGTAVNV